MRGFLEGDFFVSLFFLFRNRIVNDSDKRTLKTIVFIQFNQKPAYNIIVLIRVSPSNILHGQFIQQHYIIASCQKFCKKHQNMFLTQHICKMAANS